jgi:demethylmenaquinone methyltransferase/2-methoxy-6-polyprenyl-1,4-benzoquinol methylase
MSQQNKNRESDWFGFTRVNATEKTARVRRVFENVADEYDLMNDLMSGGVHRLWKNRFVELMQPKADKRLLDVAGGTGDIAFRYRSKAGENAEITVCDINPEMLRVGKSRAIDRGYINGFKWVEGNAESLPFAARQFDLYSISFGLRNVSKIDDALAEAARVLKPGGRFFCLEFSHVKNDTLRKIYDAYSFGVIPRLGQWIAKDRDSYQYLAESIRQFPKPAELAKRIIAAGFDDCRTSLLSGGIACVHIGQKY